MLLLQSGIFSRPPIQILTPPDRVPSVNSCITKLSDAQSARFNLCLKEVVRELENDQHVSPVANVSRLPFIFFNLSGSSTLLVTTCLLRVLFT